MSESNQPDEKFFERADAHILLANQQLSEADRGKVSASMMFAVARFNAWLTAIGSESAESLRGDRDETIEYFTKEYRAMLAQNLDDYIENFDDYMKPEE